TIRLLLQLIITQVPSVSPHTPGVLDISNPPLGPYAATEFKSLGSGSIRESASAGKSHWSRHHVPSSKIGNESQSADKGSPDRSLSERRGSVTGHAMPISGSFHRSRISSAGS